MIYKRVKRYVVQSAEGKYLIRQQEGNRQTIVWTSLIINASRYAKQERWERVIESWEARTKLTIIPISYAVTHSDDGTKKVEEVQRLPEK